MTDKNPAAVELGRKGGKAGKGKSQLRGDSAYYKRIAAKRWSKKPAPDKPTPSKSAD